jgi:hypothetical protein
MTYDSSILGFQYRPFGSLYLSWSPDFQKLAVTLAAVCIRGKHFKPPSTWVRKKKEMKNGPTKIPMISDICKISSSDFLGSISADLGFCILLPNFVFRLERWRYIIKD